MEVISKKDNKIYEIEKTIIMPYPYKYGKDIKCYSLKGIIGFWNIKEFKEVVK